jgi:phenylacetate-CoA ligase
VAIERGLKLRLGPDASIQTRIVDSIAPEASGKHRYVVSRAMSPAVDELRRSECSAGAAETSPD